MLESLWDSTPIGDWSGAFLWPLTVIRLWINLVTEQLANSKRPNSQYDQLALLLAIKTIQLNQRVLCFDPSPAIRPPLKLNLPSHSLHSQAVPSAKPPGVRGTNAI